MIRRATKADHAWIQQLAAEVYRPLGDYNQIMPTWLVHPGVLGYIAESRTHARRGFSLLGFCEHEDDQQVFIADLLALAVAPRFRRRGIGRALLQHAIGVARGVSRQRLVCEMRLTVAHDNVVGQQLYLSTGFNIMDADHGRYDGGQQAIRMSLSLPTAP